MQMSQKKDIIKDASVLGVPKIKKLFVMHDSSEFRKC